MEIRRQIGNRDLSESLPSGASFFPPPLLGAHACFECRKSFKVRTELEHVCPDCGGPLYWMGRQFKAPKKTDAKQWQKVQTLYAYGFRFSSQGGNYERFPDQLREVEEFVERNPEHPLRVAEEDLSLLPRKK